MDSAEGSSYIEEVDLLDSAEIPAEITPMQPMQTMDPSDEIETIETEIEPPSKKKRLI